MQDSFKTRWASMLGHASMYLRKQNVNKPKAAFTWHA
jgi:hypothetical protein